MKKNWIIYSVCLMLAFGLAFVGCGGDDDDPSSPNPGGNIEAAEYRGIDDQGREVVVRIFRSGPGGSVFTPANNDEYTITLDGQEVSRGRISIDGPAIYFFPTGGNRFDGTLIDWFLEVPSIPYSGGTITGFAMQSSGPIGAGPGLLRVLFPWKVAPGEINAGLTAISGGSGNPGGTPPTHITLAFEEEVTLNPRSVQILSPWLGKAALHPDELAKESITSDPVTPTVAPFAATDLHVISLQLDPASLGFGAVNVSIIQRDFDPAPQHLVIYGKSVSTATAVIQGWSGGTTPVSTTAANSRDIRDSARIVFAGISGITQRLTASNIVQLPNKDYPGEFTIVPSTALEPNPALVGDNYILTIEPKTEGAARFFINHPEVDPATIAVGAGEIITKSRAVTLGLTGLSYGTAPTTPLTVDFTAANAPTYGTIVSITPPLQPAVVGTTFITATLTRMKGESVDTDYQGRGAVTIRGANITGRDAPHVNADVFGWAYPINMAAGSTSTVPVTAEIKKLTYEQFISGDRVNVRFVDGVARIILLLAGSGTHDLSFTYDNVTVSATTALFQTGAVGSFSIVREVTWGERTSGTVVEPFPKPGLRVFDVGGNPITTDAGSFSASPTITWSISSSVPGGGALATVGTAGSWGYDTTSGLWESTDMRVAVTSASAPYTSIVLNYLVAGATPGTRPSASFATD
ncbi:MAG: hypothetical protein FWH19_00915 [Treponema sp.]|nr:hypothetical protein [Treponema sp.]